MIHIKNDKKTILSIYRPREYVGERDESKAAINFEIFHFETRSYLIQFQSRKSLKVQEIKADTIGQTDKSKSDGENHNQGQIKVYGEDYWY